MKEAFNVPIIAVGRLDNPILANSVIGNHEADLVAVRRGMQRNPHWVLEAAKLLGEEVMITKQYTMGF